MAGRNDTNVRGLLEQPNHAVVSTYNENGSIHSAVIWRPGEQRIKFVVTPTHVRHYNQ
jgi:hypothetical protein